MNRLLVNDLTVEHRTQGGTVYAVAGVNLEIAPGETLGLVGESGCGKSSLARAVTGLNPPTSGDIVIDGTRTDPRRRIALSKQIQMIFQDPFGSLNPRLTVREIVEMPLSVHRVGSRAERRVRVGELLARVGLSAELADRLPHQLSGGQRQRVGIARALVLEPTIIVCDEPVSALDVSVQAQVLNLLVELQLERTLSYLFISHDLDVIRYVSHRIAVMYLGVIVETGPVEDVWHHPRHPYTRALVATTQEDATEAPLTGELPSPLSPPSGCRFRTRCPLAIDRCATTAPILRQIDNAHLAACHRAEEMPAFAGGAA
ncbi:ABC transporter ATP-binding protein [Ancylobacter pratisalsi]|uniref:ATP-binding cassette domain-containing protein n=1 Tax=Ancylobacter pratisalsi TaxID=1745854 RepID=A0A6P1YMD4_9HYPH|nr:oligopeptide/dipeptide ABC transporter ATP-binding protein [Ancylobacter pratisalsi]QIB34597.1 ATP-binding cassette domain-containing protein [Ancylobacter pratisalsi]